MIDVTVIGNAVVDVTAYPVTKDIFKNSSMPAKDIKVSYGGDALNETVILKSLGKNVELISKVGDDEAGIKIIDYLNSKNILTDKIKIDYKTPTSVNVILADKNGERHILSNPIGSQREFCLDDIKISLKSVGKIVSFASMFISSKLSINDLTYLFRTIKDKPDIKLTVDLTKAKNGEKIDDLRKLLPYIDYIFPNEEEISLLTDNSDIIDNIKSLISAGVGCVAIKCSNKGSIIGFKNSIYHIPAYKINKCIDTTGAGDSFVAGFIWALSESWSVFDCGCFASAVASCIVEQSGSTDGMKSIEDVLYRYKKVKFEAEKINNL